ncbi:MAG: outer membrane beta-barrel protein [Ignavibacteria bacterium]
MLNKLFLLSSISILILCSASFSQPRLILHINAGYSLPIPDLKGKLPGSETDNNYHMSGGLNIGADGMFLIDKKGFLGVVACFSYNEFSNYADGYRQSIDTGFTTTQTLKMNIISTGVGLQFNAPKFHQVRPFVSALFTWNVISGSWLLDAVDTLPSTENHQITESRFGLEFGAGAEVSLHEDFGFVAGIKYHMANLIGKDSVGVSGYEYGLWDSQYTYNGKIIPAKKIQYLQFYVGISIYLMKPKKKIWIM